MMRALLLGLLAALVLAAAPSAWADPIQSPAVPSFNNDQGPDLYDVYHVLTGQPVTQAAGNTVLQPLRIANGRDEIFRLLNTDSPVIGLSAGYGNWFGYYDPSTSAKTFSDQAFTGFGYLPGPQVLPHAGTQADPLQGNFLPALPGGPVGFFIETDQSWDPGEAWSADSTWWSEAAKNQDGRDHLVAYDLSAWASQINSLYMVLDRADPSIPGSTRTIQPLSFKSPVLLGWEDLKGGGDQDYDDMMFLVDAAPVPEPGTLALLGSGIAALALTRKRRSLV